MHLGGGGGVKSPIHFHCVLHAKKGEGVQIACKIAYILNGRPLVFCYLWNTIEGRSTFMLPRFSCTLAFLFLSPLNYSFLNKYMYISVVYVSVLR